MMPRRLGFLLLLLLGASAVAWADDVTAAATVTPSAATTSTADPRSRFRMQRVSGAEGAGVKRTPVGAPQGAGVKMTPVSSPQGAGAKLTPAKTAEPNAKYQIKRVSEINQGASSASQTTASGTTTVGQSIGLDGQRRSATTTEGQPSSAAPGLHGTSFRGGRPIGGAKTSTSSP